MRRWFLVILTALFCLGAAPVQASSDARPLAIEEALQIGYAAARQWRSGVRVLRVESAETEAEHASLVPPGLDGRRRVWNMEFVDPKTHQMVHFRVADGRIADWAQSGTDTAPGFPPGEFQAVGRRLVAAARREGLEPAQPPSRAGYGFRLSNLGTRNFVIQVTGKTKEGRPGNLMFDPRTGDLLAR